MHIPDVSVKRKALFVKGNKYMFNLNTAVMQG